MQPRTRSPSWPNEAMSCSCGRSSTMPVASRFQTQHGTAASCIWNSPPIGSCRTATRGIVLSPCDADRENRKSSLRSPALFLLQSLLGLLDVVHRHGDFHEFSIQADHIDRMDIDVDV